MMQENDRQQQQVHHVANEETNRLYNLQQDQEIVDLLKSKRLFELMKTNEILVLFYFVYEIFHRLVKNIEKHVDFVEHEIENIHIDFHLLMRVLDIVFS